MLALVLGLALPLLEPALDRSGTKKIFFKYVFFTRRKLPGTSHKIIKNCFVHPDYSYMESPGETCSDKVKKQK